MSLQTVVHVSNKLFSYMVAILNVCLNEEISKDTPYLKFLEHIHRSKFHEPSCMTVDVHIIHSPPIIAPRYVPLIFLASLKESCPNVGVQ
jgi:hypothetical protein